MQVHRWGENLYYERDAEPVRFWLTLAGWVVSALIVTVFPILCLLRAAYGWPAWLD